MTDIKKIIHIADVHIPNVEEDKPYSQMIENFIFECCKVCADYNKDEVRIVLAGDIFDFKNKVSPEANSIYFKLLNYLNTIATTIIIAGNHDMLENNKQRKDALSPIFEVEGAYKNIQYADKILNYKSGYIVDNNIIWVLYSIWEKYQRPNIDEIKENIVGTILHVDLDHTLNTAGRLLSINSYNVELPDYFVTEWKFLKNENTK